MSMQTVNTVMSLRAALKVWRAVGETIAFVPTMGNLHAGHLKLVDEAKARADRVVVSIFVNPTQFGLNEDFKNYPRTEVADQQKMAAAHVDLVFLPATTDMYVADVKTNVVVSGLSTMYCGLSRPGHFDGVATIVCKLFNMVQPDIAVFGLKDFQQLAVIRTMARDLNHAIEIIGVETVREENGLALSSRNGYLTDEERIIAGKLYQNLCRARNSIVANHQEFREIEAEGLLFLRKAGFQPDYFCICRSSDLGKADMHDKEIVILAAAKLGNTRLIDNIQFSR